MQDKLLDFGAIKSFAASSAATYCENVLDLGAVSENDPNPLTSVVLGSGITAKVVFTATAATTGFTPCLYTGATATPTTVCATGSTVASLAAGDSVEIPLPFKVSRYLRAGGTATATSGAVTAHIEIGGVTV